LALTLANAAGYFFSKKHVLVQRQNSCKQLASLVCARITQPIKKTDVEVHIMRVDPDTPKPNGVRADVYIAARNRVLSLDPAEVGVEATPDMPRVWGVVMDVAYPDMVVTVVSLADGTNSLYFSNGGGVIGAGEHRPVAEASKSLISLAQEYDAKMKSASDFPLPKPGRVQFFLLTFSGVQAAEASDKELEEMRHELSPLFKQGHEVFGAIRICTDARQNVSRFRSKESAVLVIIIAVCLALGAIVGAFVVEERLPGVLMGGFIGMVVGFLGGGTLLMVLRAVKSRSS
jgi:hypothetical protein